MKSYILEGEQTYRSMPRTQIKKGFLGSELYFYCDICGRSFKEKIGGGLLGAIAKNIAADIAGSFAGYEVEQAIRSLGRHELPPDLISKVASKLHNCSNCGRWVCDSCWDVQKNMCKVCTNTFSGTPATEAVFQASASAASQTQPQASPAVSSPPTGSSTFPAPFPTAPIPIPTIVCPFCGQQTIPGPRCGNCGRALLVKCPKCGSDVPAQKYCMNCGAPLQ
ncbi:MAG: hypothetical protein ACTSQM_02720 [Candidatus Odinarchaeia archaeon]